MRADYVWSQADKLTLLVTPKCEVVMQIHCLNQAADSFLELHKAVRLKI
jgi:hypothetical protein